MILKKIMQALGLESMPEELGSLYRGARDEREALFFLKEARRRDDERITRAEADLKMLRARENDLLKQGKKETSEAARLDIAREIRKLREKTADISYKLENIYEKRLRVYDEHIKSLETIVELASEPVPERQSLEDYAIRAKEQLEDLDKTATMAEGISHVGEPMEQERIGDTEKSILEEFQQSDEAKIVEQELKVEPKPKKRLRQKGKDTQKASKEKPVPEEPEKPRDEKKVLEE